MGEGITISVVEKNTDLTVIGAGPGGYVAAIRAAQLGGKVVLVEKEEVGGVCLNKGCIPTKTLLRTTELLTLLGKAKDFGVNIDSWSVNFKKMLERKNQVVKRLVMGVKTLLKRNGVDLVYGSAQIVKSGEIKVLRNDGGKEVLRSRKIIVATGSKPAKPPIPGVDTTGVLTSDEVFKLEVLPQSLLIVGGGPVGLEFAQIFSSLGVEVTVVEMLPHLLPNEDEEIGLMLHKIMEKNGVKVFVNTKVTKIGGEKDEKQVYLLGKSGEDIKKAEKVLLAVGRTPNIEGLGLDSIGVSFDKRGISTNNKMETNVSGVYAIGDVAGKFLLAHTASEEGVVAAENALGYERKINYRAVPRCVFTVPEVACVGLTEKQAREAGYNLKIGRFPFLASGRALTMDETDGFIKVLVDGDTDEILGVHIIGPLASELIPEAVLAINLEATTKEIIDTIHAHPTLAEALKEAVLDSEKRAIHK